MKTTEQLSYLLDLAPDFIFCMDSDLRHTYVNQRVLDVTGLTREQYIGKTNRELGMPEALCDRWDEAVTKALRTGIPGEMEYAFEGTNGPRHYHARIVPSHDPDGNVAFVVGISRDITDRKESETKALRRLLELENIYNSVPVGLCLLDRDLHYLRINNQLAEINGMPASLHIGRTIREVAPDVAEQVEIIRRKIIATGQPVYDAELTGTTPGLPNVQRTWLASIFPVKQDGGEIQAFSAVVQELTDERRKRMMSKNLIELMERDRRDIGSALHDQVGQSLVSVSMGLDRLKRKEKKNVDFRVEITALQGRVSEILKQIRNISRGLVPDVLHHFGLVYAVKRLVNDFTGQSSVACYLFTKNIPKNVEFNVKLTVYRIVQESLTNILKHAAAKEVFVSLTHRKNFIFLSIEDDGKGFDCEPIFTGKKSLDSLGLFIMMERAELVGGSLHIESRPGKGTQVMVEIPLDGSHPNRVV